MPLHSLTKRLARLSLPLLCLVCLLIPVSKASADERIEEFASFVTLLPDGSQNVREEITVRAEGDKIKRGIYRDFPLRYVGPEDYDGLVPFKVLSVTLDGKKLNPNDVDKRDDVIRILMRESSALSKGSHRFVLEYNTALHVRPYAKYDEINWNATGVWGFFIGKFSCQITLPEGVKIDQAAAWTGKGGSKDASGVEISRPAPNQILVRPKKDGAFDRQLVPGEQLTVAVSFPKGAVADPMPAAKREREKQKSEEALRLAEWEKQKAEEKVRWEAAEKTAAEAGWISHTLFLNPNLPRQAVAFCLVFLFYFLFWRKVGKDPDKGTIIPRFHPPVVPYMGSGTPPAGFKATAISPAAVDFLRNQTKKLTGRAMAALFLDLAARGLCSIRRTEEGLYALRPGSSPRTDLDALPQEERAAYEQLAAQAGQDGEVVMRPKESVMYGIKSEVESKLESNFAKAWRFHGKIILLGWLVVLPLAFTLSFLHADISQYSSGGSVQISGPALVLVANFAICFTLGVPFGVALAARLPSVGGIVFLLASLLFPFSLAAVLAVEGFFSGLEWILPTAMVLVALVFGWLMKAPSKEAQAAMDEIEGLALYIGAAEKDRLEMMNKPEDTPSLFQALLPYALVLSLEKTWCNRFADQLAKGMMENSGIDPRIIDDRHTWDAFARGFSSAMVSSAVLQSSSSSDSAFSSGGGGGGAGSGSGGGGGGGL